jgi:hypothetical protein
MCDNGAGAVETMPLTLHPYTKIQRWIGEAGAQGRVWSAAIVMREPGPQSFAQMLLGQRDHPIRAFPPEGTHEPFAESIGLRALRGCFDHCKAQMLYRTVESAGEDRVTVMEDKPARMIRGDGFPRLLQGPSGGRMGRYVEMNNAA